MAMREEFDKYLLLKKLSEDPLGETFRAGRMGDGNLDQVVLLRALNGPRLDTESLAGRLPERAAVQQALKSPNIGNGVDLGVFRGVPFVAYDYISGRNLAALVQQAEKQTSPLAVDHALLITERIALALAVAYETRVGGERLTHGFLLPHLVRISNEGETRVLGFEMGTLLAEQAQGGTFEPEVSAYLAPELLAGQGRHSSDDVYSLGAILFELLTGERPSGDPATRKTQIDQARSAEDDQPLAPPLVTLLQKSLGPREQRMPEAVTWHKALSNVVMEGEHTATTFNLAFFMHNLFREEIEQETQEMEAEKSVEPPPAAAKSAATVAMSRDEIADALEPRADDATGAETVEATPPKKTGGAGLWIGVAAVLLLVLGGGAFWYFTQGPGASPEEPEVVAEPVTPPPVVEPEPEPEEPQGPTVEELQAQIQEMLDAREQEMQDRLQATYDERLTNLQRQLEQAQTEAEARERARQEELERLRSEAAEAEAAEKAAAEAAAEPETTVAETAEPESDPAAEGPARTAQARPTETQAGGESSRETSASQPPQTRPEPEPVEPEPMQMTPPELVERSEPRYPPMARRVGREAEVLLRVLVDARGRVKDVQQISKKAGLGIDQAAIEAAREATYRPGTENGTPKEMWTTLRFTFRP